MNHLNMIMLGVSPSGCHKLFIIVHNYIEKVPTINVSHLPIQ